MTANVMAYLVVLWLVHRRERSIADALAANWLICEIAVQLHPTHQPGMPVFVLIDFLTGMFLALYIGGLKARRAAIFYLPMIALNSAVYVLGGTAPFWHYTTLSALAWAQVVTVGIGVWGDGLVKALADFCGRMGLRLSVASFKKWGRK